MTSQTDNSHKHLHGSIFEIGKIYHCKNSKAKAIPLTANPFTVDVFLF